MDDNRMRTLVEQLTDADLRALASEIAAVRDQRQDRVMIEEITTERLMDRDFQTRVRREVEAALREMA